MSVEMTSERSIATLGGGCFWCIDAALRQLRGVHECISGYQGGDIDKPSYEAVCSGRSGHAEVVQVHFDPAQISYTELLEAFFVLHDPTTLNRQGHDVGSQYRSVIFVHNDAQAQAASALIAQHNAAKTWPAPIVTEVLDPQRLSAKAAQFWPAEPYHQDYFTHNPGQPYCQAVVAPKVAKLRKALFARIR
jgi:peptide-methionine (S)-S-oxide reductase